MTKMESIGFSFGCSGAFFVFSVYFIYPIASFTKLLM